MYLVAAIGWLVQTRNGFNICQRRHHLGEFRSQVQEREEEARKWRKDRSHEDRLASPIIEPEDLSWRVMSREAWKILSKGVSRSLAIYRKTALRTETFTGPLVSSMPKKLSIAKILTLLAVWPYGYKFYLAFSPLLNFCRTAIPIWVSSLL